MPKLISELLRRNVFRVAGAYAVMAWLLAQLAALLEESLNMPTWFDTMVVSCLILGFPIALIFAWAFEMTPDGVKRTESIDATSGDLNKNGRTLDYILIAGLFLVGGLIVSDGLFSDAPSIDSPSDQESTTAAADIESQSIAVLPFKDFSANKDQAYFADGISEELLNVLARVDGLKVSSRTSAFSFKDKEASIGEIAKALNVRHILEGSVRKAGDTLRITAQLIDTANDQHLWSDTYDRPLTAENIFVIQDEISQAIVLELHGRLDLLPSDEDRPTQSGEAYEAYLKGKAAYAVRTPESIENSITEFIRATTLDPNYYVAHSKLAFAYSLASSYTPSIAKIANERAQIHIEKARSLSPENWEVRSDYAWILLNHTDVSNEEKLAAFNAAIVANPNNSEAYRGRGFFLWRQGISNADEAKKSLNKAKTLNPRSAVTNMALANIAMMAGDTTESISLLEETLRTEPGYINAYSILAPMLRDRGKIEIAHRMYMQCGASGVCNDGLIALYADLKMFDQIREISADSADYYAAYLSRNYKDAARLTPKIFNGDPVSEIVSYVLSERIDLAQKVLEQNPQIILALVDETKPPPLNLSLIHQVLLQVYEHTNDPRATGIRRGLDQAFANAKIEDQNDSSAFLSGALWKMTNNDPDGAMAWLNGLEDHNIVTLWFNQIPILEPLKERSDYKEFEKRNNARVAELRSIIESQLANPPEVWWSIKEVSE